MKQPKRCKKCGRMISSGKSGRGRPNKSGLCSNCRNKNKS